MSEPPPPPNAPHDRTPRTHYDSISTAPPAASLSAAEEEKTETPNQANDPDDPDSLLAALEAETEEEVVDGNHHHSFRESRAQKLAEELRAARPYADLDRPSKNVTRIPTLDSDEEVLKFTTRNDRCLVHFSHPDFRRCAVMDTHLRRLAGRHGGQNSAAAAAAAGGTEDVRFAQVDVRGAPFVVGKLGVKVLPCLIGFRDGVAVGRMVGFEGLGLFAGNVGWEEGGVEVTRGIEAVVVGWGVFDRVTKGWGFSGREGVGSSEEDEDGDGDGEEKRRRGKGGLFGNGNGNGRRGILGRKMAVATEDDDDDDDDWD
jgi:hypothetical protein